MFFINKKWPILPHLDHVEIMGWLTWFLENERRPITFPKREASFLLFIFKHKAQSKLNLTFPYPNNNWGKLTLSTQHTLGNKINLILFLFFSIKQDILVNIISVRWSDTKTRTTKQDWEWIERWLRRHTNHLKVWSPNQSKEIISIMPKIRGIITWGKGLKVKRLE